MKQSECNQLSVVCGAVLLAVIVVFFIMLVGLRPIKSSFTEPFSGPRFSKLVVDGSNTQMLTIKTNNQARSYPTYKGKYWVNISDNFATRAHLGANVSSISMFGTVNDYKPLTFSDANYENNFWQYNAGTGSVCPYKDTNFALTLDEKNQDVKLDVWKSKDSQRWILIIDGPDKGKVMHRSTGYLLENGGGMSKGRDVAATPYGPNDANKKWMFTLYTRNY